MLNIVKKSLWNCRTWTIITSRWRESISKRDMEKNLLVLDLIIKMITIASAYEISSTGNQLCGTIFPVSLCLVLLQLSYPSTVTNREIQLKLGLNSELDPCLWGRRFHLVQSNWRVHTVSQPNELEFLMKIWFSVQQMMPKWETIVWIDCSLIFIC